jgi:hypothetical protein
MRHPSIASGMLGLQQAGTTRKCLACPLRQRDDQFPFKEGASAHPFAHRLAVASDKGVLSCDSQKGAKVNLGALKSNSAECLVRNMRELTKIPAIDRHDRNKSANVKATISC